MRTTTRKASADTYLDRVRSFPLRRLKSAREHVKAKGVYLRLSASKADPGTRDYLDVLGGLIADYEMRSDLTIDSRSITAADLVRHRLEERGESISSLAREIGIPQSNLSDMLSGNRDWSKAAIRGLSKRLNIRAERFLG